MKALCILLMLAPAALLAQSPFDGMWALDPPVPQQPIEYLLAHGVFHSSEWANVEVKADGADHKVAVTDYWDTLNVQQLDAQGVKIIAKKAGKTMFMEFTSVSEDGSTLTQVIKDTTELDTVTIHTVAKRLEKGPADAHMISGSWRAYQTDRSTNGSLITYKCTAEAFSAETPLGERFTARFDGNFYPVQDDPGQTLIAAKRISANEVQLTHKRKDKIVSISHMTVAPDGKTIQVVFENKDAGTTTNFSFHRQK